MRDYLTEQHREFYSQLNYLLIGTVDAGGQPQASIIAGPAGFINTPDYKTLRINTTHDMADTCLDALAEGSSIGVLGIDLSNRRRNRMHGRVAHRNAETIDLKVVQSYGNCPKYINTRVLKPQALSAASPPVAEADRTALDMDDCSLIERSGTFFIASAYSDGTGADYEGADVSHRGGQPGFVEVRDRQLLTIPDYQGNNMFNTLGNLLLNPRAGLLFVDFENGDLLRLNGTTEIVTDRAETDRFPSAQRLLIFKINRATRTTSGTSLRWQFVENSPYNPACQR